MKFQILAIALTFSVAAQADTLDCASEGEGTEICLMDVGTAANQKAGYPSTSKATQGTKRASSKLVLSSDTAGAAVDEDMAFGNLNDLEAGLAPLNTATSATAALREIEVFLKSGPAAGTDLGSVPSKPMPAKPK